MPPNPPDLLPEADAAWLEQALAEDAARHRDRYIDDDRFTATVMAALPAPVALPRWRKPALTGLWVSAGLGLAWVLPGTMLDVTRETFRLLSARPFSLSEVAAVLLVVGVATWTGTAMALRGD